MPGLRSLRRYVDGWSAPTPARCDLCGAALAHPHAHVVELAGGVLRCACTACALLFRDAGAGSGRFRTVPERVLTDEEFAPDDAQWTALGIPVRVAFVTRRGPAAAWFASFPSPAGPTEAPLEEAPWRALAAAQPLVAALAPDVEALVVHRRRGGRADCLLAPIDAAYELAAIVRGTWQGITGGDEVWRAIDGFFASLRARSRPLRGGPR